MNSGKSKEVKLFYESSTEEGYIKDWKALPKDIKLPSQTYASPGMNNVSSTFMGLYKTEGNDYHTSGFVGVGWLKDYKGNIVTDPDTGAECAIMIKPRFPKMDPWEMLTKVLADEEYDEYVKQQGELYTFDASQKLIPVKAAVTGGEMLASLSFLKSCEKICRRHLCRMMSFEENNFNGKIIGNIQVSKHIKYNVVIGREDRIYCRYPLFTIDTIENRILKAALKKAHIIIQNTLKRNGEIQKIYNYCNNVLKMVSTVNIVRSDFNRVKTTGCNSHYKNILKLAYIILFNEGVSDLHNEETSKVSLVIPYTINMESLFEFYVRSIIKDYFKKSNNERYHLDEYRYQSDNSLNVLDEDYSANNLYIMDKYIPDIAIYENVDDKKKYVAVFDVKYQHSTKKAYATTVRHNSHQLLFYMLLLNVTTCGFIFPKEEKSLEISDGVKLCVQDGNRIQGNERQSAFYTQWQIDVDEEKKQSGFANRMIEYLKNLNGS